MRIVFFSDAHGNQYTVRGLFQSLDKEKADLVIFGGDIFGYYYGQKEILSMLRQSKCICLLGNHDKYYLDLLDEKVNGDYLVSRYGMSYLDVINFITDEDERFLRALKSRYDMNVDGMCLTFVHGSIQDPLNGRIYPDTRIEDYSCYEGIDFVFMGHTHHKLNKKLDNGTVLINPGSIGQQRDGKGCTFGIFDTENRGWEIKTVSYNRELLVAEVKQHNESNEMEQKLIEVIYRGNN